MIRSFIYTELQSYKIQDRSKFNEDDNNQVICRLKSELNVLSKIPSVFATKLLFHVSDQLGSFLFISSIGGCEMVETSNEER